MQPQTYNRTVKAVVLNRVLLVLGFLGIYDAGLLSLEKILHIDLPCGNGGGCAVVANHPSSWWFGIPVAFFGLFGYLALTALAVIRATQDVEEWKPTVTLGYVFAGVGAVISLLLQYQSIFQIHAICLYCMGSAINMILTLIAYALLAQALAKQPKEGRKPGVDAALAGALALAVIVALPAEASALKRGTGAVQVDPALVGKVGLIPDHPNQYGDPKAPITVVEFADLCCPSCQLNTPKMHDFVDLHPGKIRVIYRHFPLPMHKMGQTAAAMAEYAADQNKFWQFALALMSKRQEPQSTDELLAAAEASGLNTKDMLNRLGNDKDPIYTRLKIDKAAADQLGVNSTPTFVIEAPGQNPEVAKAGGVFDTLTSGPYQKILEGK